MLILSTFNIFTHQEPFLSKIEEGKIIPAREIEDLKPFFSREEEEAIIRENEYMLRGPGRIERIMREELEKLQHHMDDKIRK
jgi:hypothetical protein